MDSNLKSVPENDNFIDTARKVFEFDEGKKYTPYKDTKNLWTIGIGHLIGAELTHLRLSESVVQLMFEENLATAARDARGTFGAEFYESLEPARKVAVLTLMFTLGRQKLSKFTETVPAIKAKDWQRVSKLLLATKWAKDVDPPQRPEKGRDDRIAFMFRTGEFHPDYGV